MKNKIDKINEILNGSPSRLRESYFRNNYPDILDDILTFCNNIDDIPFKQKLWHWVNNYPDYNLCKCGEKTSFNKNWLDGYRKFCSPKCAQNDKSTKEKRKNTVQNKYGVDNVAKSDDIKKKQEETNLKKWGFKSTFQNKEVQEKWKNTIREKWGVEHYFQSDEFKEKSKLKSLEKWNKEYFVQTDKYKEKLKITSLEKWGVTNFTKTKEYKEKVKLTAFQKWGVDHHSKTTEYKNNIKEHYLNLYNKEHYFQTNEFKEKKISTNLEKWGVDHHTKSDEYKNWVLSDEYKKLKFKQRVNFYKDKGFKFIDSDGRDVILNDNKCGHEFKIHPTNLQRRMLGNITVCTECNPINSPQSGQEKRLLNWILDLGLEVVCNSRKIINPYELDIYIPEYNLAIEYNGLYWHSELYKNRKYHYYKFISCEEKNIDLINVWEDDWLYKEDIIKSIILSRLGMSKNKIGARKCHIKDISKERELVNNFFNENHIQGSTKYKVALGLYNKEELVSCMLFNIVRSEIELVRFVNKKTHSIIGGASKLFKHYIDNNDINKITSFADRSIFSGNLYNKLGFDFIWRTDVNYWWVVDDIRKHRFNFNKKKLIEKGFDPNKSEIEIMKQRGYFRIFGCGLDKWVWNR